MSESKISGELKVEVVGRKRSLSGFIAKEKNVNSLLRGP